LNCGDERSKKFVLRKRSYMHKPTQRNESEKREKRLVAVVVVL
jgi:hypothetical protein